MTLLGLHRIYVAAFVKDKAPTEAVFEDFEGDVEKDNLILMDYATWAEQTNLMISLSAELISSD